MTEDFIPYEEALALKELGFNEPCLGLYHNDKTFYPTQCKSHEQFHGQVCMAPLYQQAFRWFREKHHLEGLVYKMNDNPNFFWFLIQEYTPNGPRPKKYIADCVDAIHKTYEEAELECIKQLIKIVKEKK